MAHAHEDYTGSERITLPDLYNDNRDVEIELEPGLNLAGNAQKYFERKKKSERSYEAALAYAEEVEQRLKVLSKISEALNHTKNAAELDELQQRFKDNELFSARSEDGQRENKPFKILKLGKYEIWIGKNAKSNDALLRASHKDDIWLHARSVTGSHVLVRMNKMQTDPDKRILETAASWAAWYSKAKGQELVPVICLRKKFVRKPKNAPAGTTVFDREEVIMAEPAAPPSNVMQD
jgi:predicted ribosome quality control (RQC) complex YloA/Tae2 family protein